MIYGYICVSSDKQAWETLKVEIKNFAKCNEFVTDKWVEETISSRKPLHKHQLNGLLNVLTDQAILISSEISMLGEVF